MYPAYRNFQLVVLEKKSNGLKAGEVVAFKCKGFHTLLVKRIAAVPGDKVQIVEGILYVNGIPHTEWLSEEKISYSGIAQVPLTLMENEYFLIGDNFEHSIDSRYQKIGCVSEENIVGRVLPQKGDSHSVKKGMLKKGENE